MEEILKRNLITLFTIFKNKPNLLAKYILENNILSTDMKKFIINNEELYNLATDEDIESNKPYFNNIEEMEEYYSKFFKTNDNVNAIINPRLELETMDIETLKQELERAISIEDYTRCVMIRDYCNKKGINLNI